MEWARKPEELNSIQEKSMSRVSAKNTFSNPLCKGMVLTKQQI